LGAIILLATLVRSSLGFVFFGFHNGDDVEILQAGFLRALGWPYQPWEIRNLLVSDLLAAPAIALASALGVSSTRVLAWSASLPFVVLASLNVWLVYRLAHEWLRSEPPALLAAGLYAFHWLPLGYGSMVYPRTASTTCVLLATLVLWKGRASLWQPVLAGGLVAIAWAIRFSEAVFLLPLLASVWLRGEGLRERVLRCGALVAGFLAVSLLTVGVEDWLTWGRPFASLETFVRYTLVEHRSSSLVPVQPWYLYLWRLPKWLPLTLVPFLWRARRVQGSLQLALYVLVPLLVLSTIQQKQLRYLQGSIPFLILLAAAGASSLWGSGRRRWVAILVALSLLLELHGMRFLTRKSMAAVEAARQLAALPSPPRAICLSQVWAYGGTLYLGRDVGIRELPYPLSGAALGEVLASCPWVGLYQEDHRRDASIAVRLAQQGFAPFGAYRWGRSRPVLVFCRGAVASATSPPSPSAPPAPPRRAASPGARRDTGRPR
jgi:hypothetical protein